MSDAGATKSRFRQWREAGGTLGTSWKRQPKSPTLFPFWESGGRAKEAEGVKVYVWVTLVALAAVIIGWVWWLNAAMSGGGHADRGSFLQVGLSSEVTSVPPTPLPFQRLSQTLSPQPSITPFRLTTPRATATGAPTITRAPTFAPTPTVTPVHSVLVRLSSYWPDDGPDWCLTWSEQTGHCISPLTSGDDWHLLDGGALACDPAWLGRMLRIPALGLALPCLDTGVSFVCRGRECAVGVLSSTGGFSGLHEGFLEG